MSRLQQTVKNGLFSSMPVAVKASRKDLSTWVTLVAEEDAEKVSSYVHLKEKSTTSQSISRYFKSLSTTWKIFFLVTILTNYLMVSYVYLVYRTKEESAVIVYLSLFFDVVFILNTLVQPVVSVIKYDRHEGILKTFIDALLSTPVWFAYSLCNVTINTPYIILRSLCFLRLYHLINFLTDNHQRLWNKSLLTLLAEVVVMSGIYIHGAACAWYALACPIGERNCYNWEQNSKNSVYSNYTLWYSDVLYRSYCTNSGYGSIFPKTTFHEIIIGYAILIGFLLLMYYTSTLYLILLMVSKRKINLYIEWKDVKGISPKDNHRHLRQSYVAFLTYKKAANRNHLLELVPVCMLNGVLFDINLVALKTSVFKKCSEVCLRLLSASMKHEYYYAGDLIFEQDVDKDKMIVVVSGIVEVLSEYDDLSIISFGPGTCLGEASLIMSLKAKLSLKAKTFVELQVLHRKDLYDFITHYPEQYMKIYKAIRNRIQESKFKKLQMHNKKALSLRRIRESVKSERSVIFSLYKIQPKEKFARFVEENSTMFQMWELLIVCIATVIGFTYPYYIAFFKRFPTNFAFAALIMEIILVFDVLLVLISKKVSKYRSEPRLKDLIKENLQSPCFYLDVFAACYFEYFGYLFENSDGWYYLFKLNRLVKIYKAFRLFTKIEDKYVIDIYRIRIFKYLYLLAIFIIWSSALVYLVTCFETICMDNGWFRTKRTLEHADLTKEAISRNKLGFSAYFALSYLLRFEIHEIVVKNLQDVIVTSCLILFGLCLWSLSIADVACSKLLHIKKSIQFLRRLEKVENLCEKHHMSERLSNRIINYQKLQNQSLSCWITSNTAKLKNVHSDAATECIKCAFFFEGIDERFVKCLATKAKIHLLPPSDIVTYYGSRNKEMFVIMEGLCVYKTSGGFYRKLHPNSAFGICSLLFDLPETIIVRTLTHCRLLSIDNAAMNETLILFPEVNRIFKALGRKVSFSPEFDEAVTMPEMAYMEILQGSGWRPRKCFKNLGESFVNVKSMCRKQKEKYSDIFKSQDVFSPVKYVLFPITILPDGLFIHTWVTFRVVISFLYGFLGPLQFILSPYHNKFHYGLLFMDLFCCIDLYVMMYVCFYGEHNQLITHPVKTSINYLQGSFFIDFFLTVPYEVFVVCFNQKHNEGHSEFSHTFSPHIVHCAFRLIKVMHVYKFFVALRSFESKKIVLELIKYGSVFILVVNLWSCILIVTTCKYIDIHDFNNATDGIYRRFSNQSATYCMNQSWFTRSNYRELSNFMDIYVKALYWTSQLMIGVNFAEVAVQGDTNLILSILVIITGAILFSCLVINTTVAYLSRMDHSTNDYRYKLEQVKCFLKTQNVSQDIKLNIMQHLEFRWRRNNDIDIMEFFSSTHTTLLQDTLSFFYEDTLRKVPLFREVDRSFLRILAMIVRPQYVLPGQVIVEGEDVIDEFYVIHSGKVEIDLLGSEIKMVLEEGSLFGFYNNDMTPLMSIRARTLTNVELFAIKTNDYYSLLKTYPVFNQNIVNVLMEYKDFVQSSYEGDEKFDIVVYKKTPMKRAPKKSCVRPCVGMTRYQYFTYLDQITVAASYINTVVVLWQFSFQLSMIACSALLDIFFLARLVHNFYTPYYDDFGNLIQNKQMIKTRYMRQKWQVLFDLLTSVMPLMAYIVCIGVINVSFYYYAIPRIFTLFRFVYIMRYFKSRNSEIDANPVADKLWSFVIWFTLLIHLEACMWYFINCPTNKCDGSFYEGLTSTCQKYSKSVYFALNIISGSGTLMLNLKCNVKNIYVVLMLLRSKFLQALVLASFIEILWIQLRPVLQYKFSVLESEDYLKCINISHFQVKNVTNYLKSLWTEQGGTQFPELLGKLPNFLKKELRVELYKPLLSSSYLFANTDETFLNNIVNLLERKIYFPGNIIVYDSQIDDTMYFIFKGEVEILTVNTNMTETIHDILHEKEMFGLAQGLFNGIPHDFTFRAHTRAEILSLRIDHWSYFLKCFENSKRIIYTRIKNVHVQLNK